MTFETRPGSEGVSGSSRLVAEHFTPRRLARAPHLRPVGPAAALSFGRAPAFRGGRSVRSRPSRVSLPLVGARRGVPVVAGGRSAASVARLPVASPVFVHRRWAGPASVRFAAAVASRLVAGRCPPFPGRPITAAPASAAAPPLRRQLERGPGSERPRAAAPRGLGRVRRRPPSLSGGPAMRSDSGPALGQPRGDRGLSRLRSSERGWGPSRERERERKSAERARRESAQREERERRDRESAQRDRERERECEFWAVLLILS